MRFASCPHDEEERPETEVLGSNQNLRPTVGMNIIESSLIDNADNRQRPFTQPDLRAQSMAAWKETPGNRGVDDGFGDATLTRLYEGTAGRQPHAHDLDVVRAHADHVGKQIVPLGVAGVPGRSGNAYVRLKGIRRERQ